MKNPMKNSFSLGLIIAGFFIIIFIFGALTGAAILRSYTPTTNQPPSPVASVENGGFTFTLHSVEYRQIENPLEEGYEYVIVDVSFENDSKNPVMVLPTFQVFMRDEFGRTYTMLPLEDLQILVAGELPPQAINRGEIGFATPLNAKLSLIFDTGWNGISPTIFELKR
ncbi:DUF4352 domain-containing protein [candidate division WWE3 bacterium]|uniref:DUF4352 domain-containing protein n=1 Tax=candidate division WWE3 bacterium TaxID=2053526 RepID=A0A955RQA9_UNCKA|nr:DUF4352 domain-containing protein [candidate division WWE3 bacterium]